MGSHARFAKILLRSLRRKKVPVRSFRKQMSKTKQEYKRFKRSLRHLRTPKQFKEATILMSWRSNIRRKDLHRSFMKLLKKSSKK